jgi:hypothetical protein
MCRQHLRREMSHMMSVIPNLAEVDNVRIWRFVK